MTKDNRLIWFKGKMVGLNDAKVNVLSPTSQFGINVFEGLRGYLSSDSKKLNIFRLDDHINRLLNSMKIVRFNHDFKREYLKTSLIKSVRANNFFDDIAIRQTVFLDGHGSWFSVHPVEMFIAPILKKRFLSIDKKGIHMCVSSWHRIDDNTLPPRVKLGSNYANSRLNQIEAISNNFDMGIFLNSKGKISEAPGACIFIVSDNNLITPKTTDSILESITRDTIVQFCKDDLNINVIERDLDRTELYTADEIFICGTAVEIVPVFSVDRITINNEKIGSITKSILNFYFELVRGDKNKYKKWLTSVY